MHVGGIFCSKPAPLIVITCGVTLRRGAKNNLLLGANVLPLMVSV